MNSELDVMRGRLLSILRKRKIDRVVNDLRDSFVLLRDGLLSVGSSMERVREAFMSLRAVVPERPKCGVFSEGHIADRNFSDIETVRSVNADEDLDALFARIDAEVEDRE